MAGYQLTANDIRNSLSQEGVNIPEQQPKSFLDKAGDVAGKFNEFVESSGLPNLGAHILSAPLHLGANVANAPGALSNSVFGTNVPKVEVPANLDPAKLVKKNYSALNNAMGIAGDVIGDVLTGGGLYRGAERALNIGARTPLYLRSLFGAGAGATMSDSDQPGGRAFGALLGGALPLAYGVTKRAIGRRGGQIASENQETSQQTYNNLFHEAENAGANEVRVPSSLRRGNEQRALLLKNTSNKDNARIRTFLENPSLQNAHHAQSDLGKIIRNIESKLQKGQQLSSADSELLPLARDLRRRIRGSMQSSFSEIGRPDLAEQYGEATRFHARNVAPFSNESAIAELQSHRISPAKAGKKLIESGRFAEESASNQIPGYRARRAFEELPTWQKALIGIGGAGVLGKLGVPIPHYLRELMSKGYG